MRQKRMKYAKLRELIDAAMAASIIHSWRGGGEPSDAEVAELKLKVARLELEAHISKIEKES